MIKTLCEIPFNITVAVGDRIILAYTESGGEFSFTKKTIIEHDVLEAMECTHAAVIEVRGEAGFERAIGGLFGRKM